MDPTRVPDFDGFLTRKGQSSLGQETYFRFQHSKWVEWFGWGPGAGWAIEAVLNRGKRPGVSSCGRRKPPFGAAMPQVAQGGCPMQTSFSSNQSAIDIIIFRRGWNRASA